MFIIAIVVVIVILIIVGFIKYSLHPTELMPLLFHLPCSKRFFEQLWILKRMFLRRFQRSHIILRLLLLKLKC